MITFQKEDLYIFLGLQAIVFPNQFFAENKKKVVKMGNKNNYIKCHSFCRLTHKTEFFKKFNVI